MRNLVLCILAAAVLGLIAFGCSRDPILPQAPAPEIPGLQTSSVVFTETLGDIGIPVATGTGIVVGGVGTRTTQPASISVNVPGTVKQVILFWEGNNPTAVGDNQITVEGNTVTGTLVGGPTYFYTNAFTTTYRVDITGLGVVASGANSIEVSGMNYAKNNGAGVVVIYDDGSTPAQLGLKEGNDCAYYLFAPPLDTTVPQTFTFTAGTVARQATLGILASSVEENRPNVIRVTVGGVVTDLVDPFRNSGGSKYDAYQTTVNIPAGATELTVQCLSAKDPSSTLTGLNASLVWNCAALSVPTELCSLGDFVWNDTNRNGIQEVSESGIQGVTVKLYACGGTTPVATTATNATGYYLFSGLTPGDYFVEFVPLVNYVFTMRDQGSDVLDSDADVTTGKTVCTTLTAGENDLTWDAGMYIPSASLGDFVWFDANRDGIQNAQENGIQGVPVKLYACGGTTPLATTTTNATGYYLFSNLTPGEYFVEFTLLVNHVFSPKDQGADNALDSDADVTTGKTVCTTLTAGENDLTWDAGMYIPYAELGDRVWLDENCDGIQDAEENGIAGVTVYLLPCGSMTPIATTTTNATGYYVFTNLLPGDYRVMFVKPADLEFSPQDAGANDAADSDALSTSGVTVCTTLAPNEEDLTWDAGLCAIVEALPCRMTGGGNSEAEETIPARIGNGPNLNVFSCGGQAGAPTALQPQPRGEWTHTQKRGPAGSFTFHAGTSSAPPETEIDWIACSDPGWCVQARHAPAKQLDFAGVGIFHNLKNCPPSITDFVVVGESFHWFEVNIDDLGEPGRNGHQDPPPAFCDPLGYGREGGEELADCDCPDFYRIRIYAGPSDDSSVMYEAHCYMQGGNFQIHPLTGRDLKDLESQDGKGGGRKK